MKVGDILDGNGFVFYNPDTGGEYSEQHPIRSGECDDAEHIRRSTSQEDVLWRRLQEHFSRAEAAEARLAQREKDNG